MISNDYFWLNVVLMGLGTLAIRGSFIAYAHKIQISKRWREIFSFIPAAVLPAFVAPAVFFHQGKVDWCLGKERFFVLVAATLVCAFTRSTLATIGFGLFALYLLSTG